MAVEDLAAVEVEEAEEAGALQAVIGLETGLKGEVEETSEIEMMILIEMKTNSMIETEVTIEEGKSIQIPINLFWIVKIDHHQDPHQEEDTAQEEAGPGPDLETVDSAAEETAAVVVEDSTTETTSETIEITEEVHQDVTSIEEATVMNITVAADSEEEIEVEIDSETTIEEEASEAETEMIETMTEEAAVHHVTAASEMTKRESWKKEDALNVKKRVTWLETALVEVVKRDQDSDLAPLCFQSTKNILHFCCKVINF